METEPGQLNFNKIADIVFDLAEKYGSNAREIFADWLNQKHDAPSPADWQALKEMIDILPAPGWPEKQGGEAQ